MVLWKKESASDDACYIDLSLPNQADFSLFKLIKSAFGNIHKNELDSIAHRKKGNESFQAKKWTEAIEHYNKSIRFAIDGSENLGFGYANRAACFLHLKMYDKCLADIELAKNAKYPEHLMPKLDKRKEDCLNEMKEATKFDEKMTPQLSYNPNTKFPGMADILEVRSNDEFGKHVVANRDIDVGKIVLLEDVFAFGADINFETVCKTCAKRNMNFIPCPNCVDVMFCNKNCMESNNKHKAYCGALYNRQCMCMMDVEVILIAVSAFTNTKSLMKFVEDALATRDFDSPECESDSQVKYRSFLKLFAVPHEINAVRDGIFYTYKLLLDIPLIEQFFHSKQEKRFLMHLIWQHHCILRTNRFGIGHSNSFDSMNTIAICSSFFNHSCVPNTLHLHHGNKMVAYIARPVKKGEQLFINYFKENGNSANGQKNLNFQCKCSKCVPSWKQEDRIRMQSDENYLLIAFSEVESKDLEDRKKRSILMPKFQNWFAKFGRLPWSPEFDMMEIGYAKCCDEELRAWDY